MNSLLALLGIESWKPILAALALPPVPFLLLILIGARLILPRRGLGWLVTLAGVAGLWLSTCTGMGEVLVQWGLKPPAPLSLEATAELKAAVKNRQPVAIVVLGSGVEALAPEYRVANLNHSSLERLRYGLWLSRETGAPVAFSGGSGWAQPGAQAEAQVAARLATQDFGRSIKWTEDRSHDTRENAAYTVTMLKPEGIKHIVLVTHGVHMPRAVRAFEQASHGALTVQPASMGLGRTGQHKALDWLPSAEGYTLVHNALHELLGLLGDA